MKSFGCMLAVRTPEASLDTRLAPHPEFLPSPLRDRVGYFHHDRFRGYLAVHCCSGLQPPCLRFAMAVAGHHARLGTRLRARLCRGLHFRKLNSMSFQGTTRTDPDGRSLAHPVLISDESQPSVLLVRTLAHPWDTRSPALSRVRVRWKSVLLDPRPSLPTLRPPGPVFVRMIHRCRATRNAESGTDLCPLIFPGRALLELAGRATSKFPRH